MTEIHSFRFAVPREGGSTSDPPPQYDIAPQSTGVGSFRSNPSTEKSSLDFTQRIERKLAEYNASDNVFKRWLFEMISWLISASCMIAIIFLYFRSKDQPIAKGGSIINWANMLGKVSSAALIVPTTEALGQLKWNWFYTSQAMWDFEIFDKATRGPWGALMLLFRTKGRSLAALGALLIVLLLAIDTFFQRVVDLPNRWSLQDSRGVVPMAKRYIPDTPKVFQAGALLTSDDKGILYVVEKFAYGNGTQPVPFGTGMRPDIPLSCPTSNCTWPIYETLGICSACADISSLLDFACLNMRVDWTSNLTGGFQNDGGFPNATMCGYFLNATSPNPVMMTGYIADATSLTDSEALIMRTLPLTSTFPRAPSYGNGSINFKELRNTIADVLIVSSPDGSGAAVYRNETPSAQECVLSWCVKTLQSKYSWGEYEEEVIETFANTTTGPWPWIATPYQTDFDNGTDSFFLQDIIIDLGMTASGRNITGYGTSNVSVAPLMTTFINIFPSFTTVMNESDVTPMLRYKTWWNAPALNRQIDFNPWLAPNNITRHMERLATAMTNVIRSSDSRVMLEGNAWSTETYISIRWEWLIFPLILLLLSLAFLVSTIIKTSKESGLGVWKTSAMPTLIYSLPKEQQNQFSSSSTWHSTKHTKKVRIRLSQSAGWRVSKQTLVISSPRLPPAVTTAPRGWI